MGSCNIINRTSHFSRIEVSKWHYILFGLECILLFISCLILATVAPRWTELSFDYMGVIVGVLSILVTIMVCWQISGFYRIEKKVKSIVSEQIKTTQKFVSSETESAKQSALFVSLSQLGMSLKNIEQEASAIQVLFNALCVWDESLKSELEKQSYDACIEYLKEYSKDYIKGEKEYIIPPNCDKQIWVSAALKTNDIDIVDFACKIISK